MFSCAVIYLFLTQYMIFRHTHRLCLLVSQQNSRDRLQSKWVELTSSIVIFILIVYSNYIQLIDEFILGQLSTRYTLHFQGFVAPTLL